MRKTVLAIVVPVMFLTASCHDNKSTGEFEELKAGLQHLEQNKMVAERWHNDLYVACNWEVVEEILAQDIVVHYPTGENVKGLDQVKSLEAIAKNYINPEINHYEILAAGDYVMIRWDMAFDHTKDLMGIPATGKRISDLHGIDLFRMENGKIAEFWQYYNEMGFMQQMGMLPAE
jgi:steroid delta-isomerase-like uncharacterized protein